MTKLCSNRVFPTMVLASAALALAGCGKKPPAELPPPPVDTAPAPSAQTDASVENAPQPGTQAHFEAEVGRNNTTIYFDTDRYNIDSVDAAALQIQAQYLQRYPQVTITIEGHCDERGTREYNLALGERRANAAKNYLVSLGVSPSRISTVSYGKERPVALGSNEAAWAKNRRAASVVID